jgi:hypothetical protein
MSRWSTRGCALLWSFSNSAASLRSLLSATSQHLVAMKPISSMNKKTFFLAVPYIGYGGFLLIKKKNSAVSD